jgi:competence protein ComEC
VLAAVGARSVLLTGDIGAAEEAALVERWKALRADWLAAPHHGSRSSSSAVLLGALGAADAVVQAGYRNRYGHPDPAVEARYAEHGVRLLRTDRLGALQWRFRPDGRVDVRAWRTERVRYWHDRAARPPASVDADTPLDEPPSEPFIAG